MTARSHFRGHPVFWDETKEAWCYEDNNKLVAEIPYRKCNYCKLSNRKDEHDACLGELPGVMNACCGHGDYKKSYIQFENGIIVRGFNRIEDKNESN